TSVRLARFLPDQLKTGVNISSRFYYLSFLSEVASTVYSSKGQALQLTSGLDFLSIQACRLWMEHPSRKKGETSGPGSHSGRTPALGNRADKESRRVGGRAGPRAVSSPSPRPGGGGA